MNKEKKEFIGQLLVRTGIITEEQLQKAIKEQRKGERLGQILIRLDYITERDVAIALAFLFDIPYLEISESHIDPQVVAKLPADLAHRYNLIPIKKIDNVLTVAMSDPLAIHHLDEIRLLLGCEIEPVLSSHEDIARVIKAHYGIGAETMEQIVRDEERLEVVEAGGEEEGDLEDMAKEASIISFVNQIILEAVKHRATDIHFEPFEDNLRVRYRIDGLLHEAATPKAIKHFQSAIVSRIKIMAHLNIAEKRLPQDGRIKLKVATQEIDLRVSTMPTLLGESVSIRLLSKSSILFGLEQLGFPSQSLKHFTSLLNKPHGIILVTGPTGCGKTTTLYTSLNKINSPHLKIVTIEDPIEYQLHEITQIQVKPKIGLSFANGLRSILRIDPDIIMVGEIRDLETAEIAIRAALTGHLVFSTLHTNDAPGAATRLLDMGVESYLASSSVEGVLAQRLVRIICPKCKEPYSPEDECLLKMGLDKKDKPNLTLYRGKGCDNCKSTGYYGRTGIFELLLIDEEIKRLILERASSDIIRDQAISSGMRTLREAGWEKVLSGITTVEEVLRVTLEG